MASVNASSVMESFIISVDKASDARVKAAIKAASKEARTSVNRRLKEVGEIVAVEIRNRSPRGATGLLEQSTKSTPRPDSLSVRVFNSATHSSPRYPNYRYPKRLEFDPLFGGQYAFFYPGYEAKKAEAIEKLSGVLDDIANEFGQGGT